jgi:hypothetical protein
MLKYYLGTLEFNILKTIEKPPDVVRSKKLIEKKPQKGSIEAAKACQGLWSGPDEEVTKLLAQVAKLRDNDNVNVKSAR